LGDERLAAQNLAADPLDHSDVIEVIVLKMDPSQEIMTRSFEVTHDGANSVFGESGHGQNPVPKLPSTSPTPVGVQEMGGDYSHPRT
jgi:hypothetical protein